MLKSKKLLSLLAVVLIFSLVAGCGGGGAAPTAAPSGGGNDNDIKIGFLGALTGSVANYGTYTLKGIEMAADEINAAGGINGKKITIVVEDNRGDATEIANVTQKFINKDKVAAIIGDPTTGGTKVAAKIAQENKVVLLSAGATGTGVVEIGDFIFRNTLLDAVAGPATVKYVIQDLKWSKVALITSINNTYSMGLTPIFKKAVQDNGGQIVIEESVQDGDTDFSAQITKIKAKNPDVLLFSGYYTEAALLLKEARKQGLPAKIVGGDGCLGEDLYKLGGKDAEGSIVYSGFSPEQPSPETAKFLEAFKAKYPGVQADMFVAQGYDAVKILAAAMQKANSTDPKVFKDALAQTKDFPGVSGITTFQASREPIKSPVYLLQVKDSSFKLLAKIPVEIK